MKTAFLTLSIDTKQAVSTFDDLTATAKELQKQLSKLRPDDEGFEALKEKVLLAKKEIYAFNESLRVSPSFTEKLSNAIKIGMQDVAVRAGKAEQAIQNLKSEQEKLVKEISLTSDAAKKNDLVEAFKKVEEQIKKNQKELNQFNSTLQKGFAENADKVNNFQLEVGKGFKTVGGTITQVGDNIKNSFLQVGAGFLAAFSVEKAIEFGKACVNAFAEAELNAKKLQTAVGVNGGVQADFEKLIAQSEELQKKSIFSDDAVQKAQTAALQFGLTADEVERLLPIVVDFASATGQDLNSAMEAVLKSTEGGARGLKQYGISVDENLTGSGKLAQVTDELSKKFQGQAEIVAGTTAGGFELLKNKIGDLQENMGGFLSDLGSGAATLAAFALNGFKPLSDAITETNDKLFKTRESLVQFQITATINQITSLKNRIEELSKADAGNAVSELTKQLKVAQTQLVEYQKEQLTFASDETLKTKFKELEQQVQQSNSIFGDNTQLKQQFEFVKQELEKRRIAVISNESSITTATTDELNNRLEELKKIYEKTNSFDTKSTIDAIEKELKLRKDGVSKTQQELKKQYDEGLRIVQQANQTEIATTEQGTIARVNAEIAANEKEKQYKIEHLSELIESEGRFSKDSESFNKELAARKENIIATSNEKEIQLEKNKQALLKSLFQESQAERLSIFPEGTVERIEEQIRQAQDRLRASLAQSQSALSITPQFNPADLVKYASEIKKLYADLAAYNASIKKTELLSEQSAINAKLAAAKKGSDEELDLKRQLIENKKQLDLNEVNSKLAAYDSIRQAGIQLNAQELADYQKLQNDKAAITAQANQQQAQAQNESYNLNLGQTSTYLNGFASSFNQAFDAINTLEKQRTDVQLQNIQSSLNSQIASLNKQEEQELKTSTNKEVTQAKFRRRREAAEKQAHDQERKLKKKQFEADKKAAIIKAIISTALAVVNALGSGSPPLNFIFAALAAVAGGIEIAAISSQPTPEFKQGGVLNMIPQYADGGNIPKGNVQGVVQGATHQEGGIKLVDSKTANVVGEIEGNETILTAGVAKNPELLKAASEINVRAGGKPFLQYGGILQMSKFTPTKYESGGVVGSTSVRVDNTVDFSAMQDFLKAELNKPRKSYVIGNEITNQQNVDSLIERRSKLVA